MIDRTVLKEGPIFLVTDRNGDVASYNADGHGLYWRDTRFLSLLELTIQGTKPTLLSSVGEYSFMNNFQFANIAMIDNNGVPVERRTISIRRNRFIEEGLHERIGLFNYNAFPVALRITLAVGSDFRDMFDVRSYTTRPTHGTISRPLVEDGCIRLSYLGLDRVRRATELLFEPWPTDVTLVNLDQAGQIMARVLPGLSGRSDVRTEYAVVAPSAHVHFDLTLLPMEPRSITVHVAPRAEGAESVNTLVNVSLDQQFALIRDSYRRWEDASTSVETDHAVLNAVIQRAGHDLRLLSDLRPGGYLTSAGVPWFSVPFGRDGLITALQTLMFQPGIGYGMLRFLAQHQGRRLDAWRNEEPGKILHEARTGEVSNLGEVPHSAYYGSIDSTPLFLVALGELLDWTGDAGLAEEFRPTVDAALEWVDRYGDFDDDGYVEYASCRGSGVRNNGWKDSFDAIAHPDRRLVEPPIALAEVQGYVYDARLRMAAYYRTRGEHERADYQASRADRLKQRFGHDFWVPDLEYYAIALGPDKAPVQVISSNPGHCLWSGLLDKDDGRAVARRLLREDVDSGWGIRTLGSREAMFNPMSYHNGSVWPHDTAIIAAGLKRIGMDAEATHLVSEVLEAAMRFPQQRLPEFYCGFGRDRQYFSMPAGYPTSCSPQAWAAGAVFHLIQTMLGLRADAGRRRLEIRPFLPEWLNRVSIRRLRLAGRSVDFDVFRKNERLQVEVSDSGGLDVAVMPPDSLSLAS